MPKKMYIDASHPEETRVAVVSKGQVEDFDFESQVRKSLRGNIYLARVTRVEPSLQAAFVEYGGNRHGFLAFSEIHPDYYQVPVSDRESLQAAEDLEADLSAELERLTAEREEAELAGDTAASEHAEDDLLDESNVENTQGGEALVEIEPATEAETEAENTIEPHERKNSAADLDEDTDDGDETPVVEIIESDEDTIIATQEGDDDNYDISGDGSEGEAALKNAPEPSQDSQENTDNPPALLASAHTTQSLTSDIHESPSSESHDSSTEESPSNQDPNSESNDTGSPNAENTLPKSQDKKSGRISSKHRTEEQKIEAKLKDARRERIALLRNYRIQEVIKRRQILLIQVVKEERGNKGAAVTTYLSLAGRYGVLMPNTAKAGGISRKISNATDRKRLRKAVADLDIPKGIGLIIRTAGAKRTKSEIKRDYDYLIRLWQNIRDLTMKSIAPSLIYEEASLIKRAIRDMYDKDTEVVKIEGETGYREAKDFMKMLMPSHAKHIQPHKKTTPLFLSDNVESQLDEMYQPVVKLQSGGYLVIQQTEALIAIDVNSGRATTERNIEATALKTNLEAAQEVARQCRLRDLAGLVVIDFIDMEENRNNRAVEKKIKEAMKTDRARIQIGRISSFGLMELSRQRRRSGIVDGTTQLCPTCNGAGAVRSIEMAAMRILRAIEIDAVTGKAGVLTVKTSLSVAMFVLNNKRTWLDRIETNNGVTIEIIAGENKTGDLFEIEKKGTPRPIAIEHAAIQADLSTEGEEDNAPPSLPDNKEEAEGQEQPKKRRRRRRKGKSDADAKSASEASSETADTSSTSNQPDAEGEPGTLPGEGEEPKKRRRRGRRGGKKSRKEAADTPDIENSSGDSPKIDKTSKETDEPVENDTTPAPANDTNPSLNLRADVHTDKVLTDTDPASADISSQTPRKKSAHKRPAKQPSLPAPVIMDERATLGSEEGNAAAPQLVLKTSPLLAKDAPIAKQAPTENSDIEGSDSSNTGGIGASTSDPTPPPAPTKKRSGWWQRALKID